MGNPLPVHLPQECAKAVKILNEFVDPVNGLDKIVPLSVLTKAKGFAIFSVFRIGFILSARAGSGVVIAKTEQGRWSAPAAIGIGGLGGGFNAGAEVTDFLVVLNSKSAVRSFMATGSLQLGGNLSVAIGPVGRSAEASGSVNTKGRVAAMFSYSKSKGFYGGISLEGTVLVDREDANYKAYGTLGKNAKQILSGSVDCPQWASGLVSTLDRFTLINTPSKDLDGEYFNYDDTSSFDTRGLAGSGGRRDSTDSASTYDPPYRTRRDAPRRTYSGQQTRRQASMGDDDDDDLPSRFDEIAIHSRTTKSRSDWDQDENDDVDDRRRRNDIDTRSGGSYAFGSPSSSLSHTLTSSGTATSPKAKRPTNRHRSSSIASNLSFSSLGRKKLDRSGPTPPPDWDEIPGQSNSTETWAKRRPDGMDALDRELQNGGASNGSAPPSTSSRQSPMPRYNSYGNTGTQSKSDIIDRRRRGSSISNTNSNSNSGRGTPANWSQFTSNDGANDDLFDDSHVPNPAHDPFADLAAGLEQKWTGNKASVPSKKGAAPPASTKSPSSFFGRSASYRTPSPGSSVFGRRKTPTIAEDEYGGNASLIDRSQNEDEDEDYGQDELLDRLRHQQQEQLRRTGTAFDDIDRTGTGQHRRSSSSHESFSLSNTNASVPVVERVVALFDFEAQEEGDLGFQKGQVIGVTKKTGSRDDWWQGRVEAGMSASNTGIFPANYTQSI